MKLIQLITVFTCALFLTFPAFASDDGTGSHDNAVEHAKKHGMASRMAVKKAACNNIKKGNSCSFTHPNGKKMEGTCSQSKGLKTLACKESK